MKKINESNEKDIKNINIKISFNAYYSEKSKKFDGGLYPILEYIKENTLKNAIVRLDYDNKGKTSWDEVDLFCEELSIKELSYEINDKYPKYIANIVCKPNSGKCLIKMLIEMALLGNGGHSYGILINDKKFGFDGDGADHISSINDIELTSEIYKNQNKKIEIYNKGIKNEINENMNNKQIKMNDKQFKTFIKESVRQTLNEISKSNIKRKYINQLYKLTKEITSHIYRDDDWRMVRVAFKKLEDYVKSNNGEIDIRVENGGYWKQLGEFPNYKEYKFIITLDGDIEINGSLKCHSAGTIEDTFSRYDMTITFW